MTIPPRLAPLLAQFDDAFDRLVARVDGLTDGEYLWEPVPNCWSVRTRANNQTKQARGKGDWVIELDRPEPDPPPFTTLAWRMCHVASGLMMRTDYTTGTKRMIWDDYVVPSTAEGGIASLVAAGNAWRALLAATTDADLDQIGRSQTPGGLDPTLPFLTIIWWVNQEVILHGAEIALLRDLFRAQPHG